MEAKPLAVWLEGNSHHIPLFLKGGGSLAELAEWFFNLPFAVLCLLLRHFTDNENLAFQGFGTVCDRSLAQTCNLYTNYFICWSHITWGHKNIIYWVWKWQFNKQYKLKKMVRYFVLPVTEFRHFCIFLQNLVLLIKRPFSYSELIKNSICFYDIKFLYLLKIATKNELSIFKGKNN